MRTAEAVFEQGVLKPVEPLDLAEHQRVRLTIEPLVEPSQTEKIAARARFRMRAENSDFRSGGRLPTRDELHDRA